MRLFLCLEITAPDWIVIQLLKSKAFLANLFRIERGQS